MSDESDKETELIRGEEKIHPEVLDQFELVAKIGGGGMGEVWRARDRRLDRLVAIKVMREKFGGSHEFKERFLNEAKIVASLNHPNIVHVLTTGEHPMGIYIAMELIDGHDLAEELKLPVTLERIRKIFPQLLEGLRAAHEKGIIHRDIKPTNIMITKDDHVKILDFGLAKSEGFSKDLTQTGSVLGTVAYMAPEVVRGEAWSKASDIYSLGMVLHEMLTGAKHFKEESPLKALERIKSESLPSPKQLDANIDSELSNLCMKMCAKETSKRYTSINEVLGDWNLWLNGEATQKSDSVVTDAAEREVSNYGEIKVQAQRQGIREEDIGNFMNLAKERQDEMEKKLGLSTVYHIASEMKIESAAVDEALYLWKKQKELETQRSNKFRVLLYGLAILVLAMLAFFSIRHAEQHNIAGVEELQKNKTIDINAESVREHTELVGEIDLSGRWEKWSNDILKFKTKLNIRHSGSRLTGSILYNNDTSIVGRMNGSVNQGSVTFSITNPKLEKPQIYKGKIFKEGSELWMRGRYSHHGTFHPENNWRAKWVSK